MAGPRHGPPSGGAPLVEAGPVRRPVHLFPERHVDFGLAPSPSPSRPDLPPRAPGKEGPAVEQQPSLPPLKGRHLLSPWQVEERSGGIRKWMMEECGMPSPPLLIKGRSR